MIKKIGLIIALLILLCSCSKELKTNSLDIKSFIKFENAALKVDFKSDRKDNDIDSPYPVAGKYDMDSDGKLDTINITLSRRVNNQDSSIQINDKNFEIIMHNPGKVYLVDIDQRDKYIELAIFDDGPSGDPNLVFFRYTGSEILCLGTIYGSILTDNYGKVISTWEMVNFEPEIVLGVHEIKDNEFVFKKIDFNEALNKEYLAASDTEAYFKEMDKVPDDFIPSYTNEDKKINLKKGDRFKIEKISIMGNHPYWYSVELSNGKKGALYFWNGD
jgi:hypothetical protein